MPDTAEPLALIGDTPMIELTSLDFGPCRVFAKLESQNPTGSIKDRIAMSMVDAAERSGALKPGGRIIEATAGNTGLALALVAARRGYRLTLVIPDKMSREKIAHLRAMGVEVVLTRSDVPKAIPSIIKTSQHASARKRAPSTRTSSTIRITRPRMNAAPAPRSGTRRKARSMRSWLASAPAER